MPAIECPSCKTRNSVFPGFKGKIRCSNCKGELSVSGRHKKAELMDAKSLSEKLRNLLK